MNSYVLHLWELINLLTKKDYTVEVFRDKYYDFYLEDVPDDALTDDESVLFGSIHEKLDWVDENPNEESRSFGWINNEEFIIWVNKQVTDYSKKLKI